MSDTEVERVVQLTLTRDESELVSWSLQLAVASVTMNVPSAIASLQNIEQAIAVLTPDGYNAFIQRIAKLLRAGFPDLAHTINKFGDECTHCACTDPVCCWCGRRKDGLD